MKGCTIRLNADKTNKKKTTTTTTKQNKTLYTFPNSAETGFDCLELILNSIKTIKGVQSPWALFLKTLCIFSKKIKQLWTMYPMDSSQKCFKELKNHSFTLVETIVVKLQ